MVTTESRSISKGSDLLAQSDLRQSNVLSVYEKARAINIEKNNARLRALGLISANEELKSNASAWGLEEKSSNIKRKPSSRPPNEGCRKSRRLLKLSSEISENVVTGGNEEERQEGIEKEREAIVKECREARQRAAMEVARLGVESAARENPTATYEHCLMRIRSMTKKGLINRVRSIERGAGKHCVVKMAIFKSCLQDENMWELAKLASEALERLKGLQSPP
mmetsp:Transcript_28113/g.57532  ORF Transcript_28113/g.57532 Transcript_28113/m.57532 type:complete len:223 (-) Transcript_28113:1987-2655(-)